MVVASGRLLELLVEVKVEDGFELQYQAVDDLDLDGMVAGLLWVGVCPLGVARQVCQGFLDPEQRMAWFHSAM
jgi:hypothetical protein